MSVKSKNGKVSSADNSMSKTMIIEEVASKTNFPKKDVEETFNAIIEVSKKALKKELSIKVIGFGTLAVKERKARNGINPATGKTIKIPATKTVSFKVSKSFKAELQ